MIATLLCQLFVLNITVLSVFVFDDIGAPQSKSVLQARAGKCCVKLLLGIIFLEKVSEVKCAWYMSVCAVFRLFDEIF